MALTLADYRSRVTGELNMNNTAAGAEQVLVDGWVNEGVLQFILETECNVCTSSMDLIADVEDYDLSESILVIKSMIVTTQGGQNVPLQPVDNDEIDWLRLSSVGGTDPYVYAISGSDLLRVYPKPTAADTVILRYVPIPATLSAGSDSPTDIPDEWHQAPEAYAKWKAQLWLDNTSVVVDRYRGEWETWILKARKGMNKRRGPWGPVHRRGKRSFPISNGVDYRF